MIRRHPATVTLACIAGSVVAVILLDRLDLLRAFRETPLWSAGAAHRPNYYNDALSKAAPLFWPLVPFAVLSACVARPRWALTLSIAAASALLVHSLAASKSSRYVYYCLPLICILLGAGLSTVFSFLAKYVSSRWPPLVSIASLLALATLGVSFAASQEGYRTSRLLLGLDPYSKVLANGDETSWSSAQRLLLPLAANADAIVTSNSMKAIYYLGRYDYELNTSIVAETNTGAEFGIDERTGRRAISTPESLAQVLRTHATTLIVAEKEKLGLDAGVPAGTAAVARERCGPIPVPDDARIAVWWCPRGSSPSPPPATGERTE